MFGIDTLKLLSGSPVRITDKITFTQPSLREVIENGEERYYKNVYNLTVIPSDMKSVLWDAGIDWMQITDLELFYSIAKDMSVVSTSIFFPGIDFSKFVMYKRNDGDIELYCEEQDIKIDFLVHKKMMDCLCKTHGIKKKVERAGNKYTKQVLIEEDRQNRARKADKEFESNLYGLVSALVNYSGFKYDYSTVWDLKMFQFMDAVQRCRLINTTDHLISGIYAGTVDPKKIKNEKLNWMREIRDE